MKILPFDSHNHVHMGPNPPALALLHPSSVSELLNNEVSGAAPYNTSSSAKPGSSALSGMAIMSTHPRDFEPVLKLATHTLPMEQPHIKIVPCFGVHPWFLHELSDEDWNRVPHSSSLVSSSLSMPPAPAWLTAMEQLLLQNPCSIVGEIGLDGFHFDGKTRKLVSPVEKQVEAFRLQLELASRLKRPVSIHCVRSFGPLMETLSKVKKTHGLPPKLYFHAFGGKSGTVDQLVALCGREAGRVYFGFAPIINARSPKTPELIRKIGLDQLVIETDHENSALVPGSIQKSVQMLSEALGEAEDVVIETTTKNAFELFGIDRDLN